METEEISGHYCQTNKSNSLRVAITVTVVELDNVKAKSILIVLRKEIYY